MIRTPLLAVLAGGLFSLPLSAQLSFGGRPYGAHGGSARLAEAPVHHFPAVDVDALMAEDEARAASGIKGPARFGYTHPAALTLANSGIWSTMPNGDRVWRLTLACDGAIGINFAFSRYVVPEGAYVFVYNQNDDVLGGFTAESAGGTTEMGVAPIPGDRITVEYVEPASVAEHGQLTIGAVTHEYRDAFGRHAKGFGDSDPCNVNTVCPDGDAWRSQIRSVARIVNGGDWCTGQLLNDCAQDGTPYFLTANHCVVGENNIGSWVFMFNWESPTCTPTNNAPTGHTISGATLLVHNSASDVALLQLNSAPPANFQPFFTGWDKSGTTPENQTCIHHPSGDIKKISHDYDPAGSSVENFGEGNAQCWWIHRWDTGTTEGGSSGSGLWDQNGRLIGQLYGGAAFCGNSVDDFFGKFSVSYPFLEPWLGSCGNTLEGFEPNGVGIAEPGAGAATGMSVFPNPTADLFTVVLPEHAGTAALRLSDATGRVVLSEQLPAGAVRSTFDAAALAPGLYLAGTIIDGKRLTQPVVVRR